MMYLHEFKKIVFMLYNNEYCIYVLIYIICSWLVIKAGGIVLLVVVEVEFHQNASPLSSASF